MEPGAPRATREEEIRTPNSDRRGKVERGIQSSEGAELPQPQSLAFPKGPRRAGGIWECDPGEARATEQEQR